MSATEAVQSTSEEKVAEPIFSIFTRTCLKTAGVMLVISLLCSIIGSKVLPICSGAVFIELMAICIMFARLALKNCRKAVKEVNADGGAVTAFLFATIIAFIAFIAAYWSHHLATWLTTTIQAIPNFLYDVCAAITSGVTEFVIHAFTGQ